MKHRTPSAGNRIAIAVIAIFALLGEVLLSPAAAQLRRGDAITCAIEGSQPAPANGENHGAHHGDCCIIACAISCLLLLTAAAAIAYGWTRTASRAAFAAASAGKKGRPEQFYLSARGPPLSI